MPIQTLSPNISAGNIIGAAVRQGLEQGGQNAVNYQIERSRLQNALGQLKNLSPNASPFELATTLLSATAGQPDASKVVGQLYPLLLNQLQNKQFANTPQPSQQNIAGMAQGTPQVGTQTGLQSGQAGIDQASNQPSPVIAPKVNLEFKLPEPALTPFGQELEGIDLGTGPIPRTYSPEQYRDVANQYKAANLDPTPAIEQMQLEDQASRARLQDIIGGAKTVSDISQLRRQQQEAFRDILKEQLPNLNEQDFAIAERIAQSPELRKIKNDKIRAEQVRKEFNIYQGQRNNFADAAQRHNYNPSEYDRQKKALHNYAQTMIKYGQRDEAEKILKNDLWGSVETSEILNPLPSNFATGLKKLPEVPDPQTLIKVPFSDERFDKEAEKALETRNKIIDKYKDYIQKNFKTGSYDPSNIVEPGTSLLQTRDLAMQNGVTYQEFDKIIRELIDTGKIKLDKYQDMEKPLLFEHPNRSFGIGEILWRLNPFYTPRK